MESNDLTSLPRLQTKVTSNGYNVNFVLAVVYQMMDYRLIRASIYRDHFLLFSFLDIICITRYYSLMNKKLKILTTHTHTHTHAQ